MRQNNNCDDDIDDVVGSGVVVTVVVVEDGRCTTTNAKMEMNSRTATIQVHTNRCCCWNGGDGILLVVGDDGGFDSGSGYWKQDNSNEQRQWDVIYVYDV